VIVPVLFGIEDIHHTAIGEMHEKFLNDITRLQQMKIINLFTFQNNINTPRRCSEEGGRHANIQQANFQSKQAQDFFRKEVDCELGS
jgi:hypothetical protein